MSGSEARNAGVLVHPTSLPGPCGIGELGSECRRFLDWAAEAGLRTWQILPLSPVGPGNSPYSSPSAFAGNPLLISPRTLCDEGWLDSANLDAPDASEGRVDYAAVRRFKLPLLRRCWDRFRTTAPEQARRGFESFVEDPAQRFWLEDWALFAAIGARRPGRAWTDWEPELRGRDAQALRRIGERDADEVGFQRFLQFAFDHQWHAVRRYANRLNISVLGDLPFYVTHDSADVWAHQRLFRLDDGGRPREVAGVPPDYFSETGQLWGNPLFDWGRLAEEGFGWWIERLRTNLRLSDRVRLDHFRAFSAFWKVDVGAASAIEGEWEQGPGDAFFESLREALGGMPLVAEDLGDIDAPVRELRDRFGLPGMRVLQFGLLDESSEHHPDHHVEHCVAYTGTHDNDTATGWFGSLGEEDRRRALEILGVEAEEVARGLVERLLASPARCAIAPLQDLLGLGPDSRMNVPGVEDGNWTWRVDGRSLTAERAAALRRSIAAAGRA